MDIRNENNASGGRYVATVEGHEAEMTFSRTSPRLIIVDHTGVPDALRGKESARRWRFTPSKRRGVAAGKSSRSAPSSRLRRNVMMTGATSSISKTRCFKHGSTRASHDQAGQNPSNRSDYLRKRKSRAWPARHGQSCAAFMRFHHTLRIPKISSVPERNHA